VNTAACAGCGTCAAECKFDAIIMNHFTDEQILSQSHALLETEPHEKSWYLPATGAHMPARITRGSHVFNIPQTCALSEPCAQVELTKNLSLNGFLNGAPVVLVSGCHMGDCHYIDANHWTEKRVKKYTKKW